MAIHLSTCNLHISLLLPVCRAVTYNILLVLKHIWYTCAKYIVHMYAGTYVHVCMYVCTVYVQIDVKIDFGVNQYLRASYAKLGFKCYNYSKNGSIALINH